MTDHPPKRLIQPRDDDRAGVCSPNRFFEPNRNPRQLITVVALITHVNFRDSMIFMKNGMCYGTEGRTKRRRSIVACKQLAVPIHFKFRDIEDLEFTFLPPYLHEETARDLIL